MNKFSTLDPDPEQLYNALDSDLGVIIDCKDTESPTTQDSLELRLAEITRQNLVKYGFGNIVAFEDRDDFDLAINTLEQSNVSKVLTISAGGTIGKNTMDAVINCPHITAHVYDGIIARQYLVFDIAQYTYFQMRGAYLNNVKKKIHSKHTGELDIALLYPDENTYKFLDAIVDGNTPDIQSLSEIDQYTGNIILERIDQLSCD